jgi:hypothetical protein
MIVLSDGRATSRQLAAVDVNFHDLRRESGSRFPEHGMARPNTGYQKL